jgi:YXWGXW repeat-containing protein
MRIARFISSLFLAVALLAIPVPSRAQVAVGISVRIGPPVLPVYVQPVCPAPGYIWVPGYWAYGPDGYFWVPGTWVLPPEPGLLWTPGYWGWGEGFYVWHVGYWGPVVGFYGGINYGFGYPGVGFYGGYWRGGTYFYNRSVTNVNVTVVHNVYERTVINERNVNRVSFNGGSGGINARPSSAERAAEHERHVPMTAEQTRHFDAARSDRSFLASVNHGHPDVAASPRPGEFHGRAAVDNGRLGNLNRPPDNRSEYNRPGRASENRGRTSSDRPGRPVENGGRTSSDRPPYARSSSGASSNPALNQKHQRETDKMQRQQDAERQKLQQRHNQEQQKLQQRNASQQRQDQLQRRQQQQAQQMQQRHAQQTQKLQEHQQKEVQTQQPKEPKGGRPQGR